MSAKILFIDRDGTLVEEPDDFQIDQLRKVRLMPNVIPALQRLRDAGYRLVMVSNQDGLGSDTFPLEDFESCQQHILSLFDSQGLCFDEVMICPHRDADRCECRKPRTGLLTAFLARTNLDLERSAVIGDRDSDLQLAANLGLQGLRVALSGRWETSWPGIANALLDVERTAVIERVTKETRIRVALNLDSEQPVRINSGMGFLDHMLEQIARHAAISMDVDCQGDLHIDDHHTTEDIALCLGEALRKALGDKQGIGRFGFLLPMDETEARVSIDLSGRPYFKFTGVIPRAEIGGLATEMVPHFFRSLADALAAAIHIEVSGDNSHHMVEACFKSLGRALRGAVHKDGSGLPSTKGVLA